MRLTIAISVLLAAVAVSAQPAFEVASIKRADPNEPGEGLGWKQGGRLVATCLNVRQLIVQAYGVFDFQVSGGPHWIDSDPFDINAKPDPATAAAMQNLRDPSTRKSTMNAMFQNLLADRFRLQLSRETREMPVYELVVAKGGSKLRENTTPGDVNGGGGGDSAHIRVTGTRMTLAWLIENLSGVLQRPIIDRTGLAGKYDYSLEWGPDQLIGPSVFTALQEQLGLKLESAKSPVEILVINRVERPTEN